MAGTILKKCPVCGSRAEIDEGGFFYWVKCTGCGLTTEIVATPEEAAGLWNPRVQAEQTARQENAARIESTARVKQTRIEKEEASEKRTVLTEKTVLKDGHMLYVSESRFVEHTTEKMYESAFRGRCNGDDRRLL